MVLVTTVVLANHSSFTSTSLLRTQAYDVALRIREVQQAAVSSQNSSANDFRAINGVQFSAGAISASAAVDRTRYRAFSTDEVTSATWENDITPLGALGVLDSRFEFGPITTLQSNGTESGGQTGVFITFMRPNFDARFFRTDGVEYGAAHVAIRIGVRPRGSNASPAPRYIVISRSGQITVE